MANRRIDDRSLTSRALSERSVLNALYGALHDFHGGGLKMELTPDFSKGDTVFDFCLTIGDRLFPIELKMGSGILDSTSVAQARRMSEPEYGRPTGEPTIITTNRVSEAIATYAAKSGVNIIQCSGMEDPKRLASDVLSLFAGQQSAQFEAKKIVWDGRMQEAELGLEG